ncbi:MAG: rhodanese-like domain-containing protein [Saprospiraceae bacterium]
MQKLLFVLLTAIWACTQPAPAQSVLDAAKTEAMLKADPSVQLVDLRTPGEIRQTGKIAGALEINFNSADFAAQIGKLDKSKPVVVYCAAGGRSPRAAAQLTKVGFKNVYDYAGGMNDWQDQGKKTVPGSAGQ